MKYVQESGQILINFLPNFWLLKSSSIMNELNF